jgi:hypothetical protein
LFHSIPIVITDVSFLWWLVHVSLHMFISLTFHTISVKSVLVLVCMSFHFTFSPAGEISHSCMSCCHIFSWSVYVLIGKPPCQPMASLSL